MRSLTPRNNFCPHKKSKKIRRIYIYSYQSVKWIIIILSFSTIYIVPICEVGKFHDQFVGIQICGKKKTLIN